MEEKNNGQPVTGSNEKPEEPVIIDGVQGQANGVSAPTNNETENFEPAPAGNDFAKTAEAAENDIPEAAIDGTSVSVGREESEVLTETAKVSGSEAEAAAPEDSAQESSPEKSDDGAIITEPIKESSEKKIMTENEKAILYKRVVWALGIIAVLIFISWLVFRDQGDADKNLSGDNVKITVDPKAKEGTVSIIDEVRGDIKVGGQTISSDSQSQGEGYKITVYYLNTKNDPEMKNCGEVHPLERIGEKKYDSNIVNTVRGLLAPLTQEEKDKGYSSAIPENTFLQYVKLNGNGNMEANFSGQISKAAGSCAVTAIRAQISQTLMQFANVKTVTICINGNCKQDEILQP